MAARTSAGTGVVVSLVVFILTTVFLLVMTIVFYAGKTKETELRAEADRQRNKYITREQLNSDAFKPIEVAAGSQSVAGHLLQQNQNLMAYLAGNPATTMDDLKAQMARHGVPENGVAVEHMATLSSRIRRSDDEVTSMKSRLQDREDEISQLKAQIEANNRANEETKAALVSQISEYQRAGDIYGESVRQTVGEVKQSSDRLRNSYEDRVRGLEGEIDSLNQENLVLKQRINEFEARAAATREKADNPALLVDGRVIELAGSDEVFIDLGQNKRMVLGMTFEVYDNADSIRVDRVTGALPRGKASMQVVKVGPSTSTARVTRSVPGRPVVRGDVIANAVYDPNYRFKFLIHGRYDVDQDGRPSEAEAEYLRSLVKEWGGSIVIGEEIPGDLDFLVLGVEPPRPSPLPPDANDQQLADYIKRVQAFDTYQRLFRQATEAQIPVLNSNRFLVLIGRGR